MVRRGSVPWLLTGLVLLGAWLRLFELGTRSFWQDEAFTIIILRGGLGDMLQAIAERDGAPPLYYVLTWLWTQLAGTSEAGIRSFSVLVGVATIPVAYAAAAHVAGRRTGLVVALLAATSPPLVWHAQDARAYALLILLASLSFLGFVRALHEPSHGRLALWASASALALWTHYFAFFLVAAEGVLLLVRRRRPATAAAVAAVCATGLALIPLVFSQRDSGSFIAERPFVRRISQVPAEALVGYQPPAEITLSLVAALLAGMALVRLLRRSDRGRFALPAAVGGLTVAAPLLLALLGLDYVYSRNLSVAWLPLVIVLAGGLTGRVGTTVLAALVALSLAIVIITADRSKFERQDWRTAFAALGRPPEGGRAIVVKPNSGLVVLEVYRPLTTPLTGSARVREVALVLLPPRFRSVGRAPTPPREHVPAPPGFTVGVRQHAPTHTLVRFHAREQIAVTAEALRRLGGSDPETSVALEPGP